MASTSARPELAGLIGASDAIRRQLFDACDTLRTLESMSYDGRRGGAIDSERDRARALCERYRQSVERVIEAMGGGA